MKIWTEYWRCSNRYKLLVLILAALPSSVYAQSVSFDPAHNYELDYQGNNIAASEFTDHYLSYGKHYAYQDTAGDRPEFPHPRDVLIKSLIIPGWGQVVNDQAWKVPLVYGLLGGLTWYSIYLTKQYHDFRAARYNAVESNTDLRFGPTPPRLQGLSTNQLESTRDRLRNRRDFIYVTIGLAYGLNVIDAYVFAHMRTFDISDDLSMRTKIKPDIMQPVSPGITVSLEFFSRNN